MKDAIRSAQDFLLRTQLSEGGWGYTNDATQAYPEPSCYSLLALKDTSFSSAKTLSWLSSLVHADGKLFLPGDNLPNWGTSLLLMTLTRLNELPVVRQSSIDWLVEWKSKTGDASAVVLLNGNLVGWSWISDTFSWVQPTSYAVLALKLAGLKTHQRVKEAEELLFDRMCLQGGWNFGNPVVLGQPIDPSAMETAFALFALQDIQDTLGRVEKGLDILEQTTNQSPTTMALALCILCLDIFKRPVDRYIDLLIAKRKEDGSWDQKTWWTAISTLALQAADGGENVFKL